MAKEWTVRQAWTILRSALSAAQREELVTRNVAGLVRMPERAGLPEPGSVDFVVVHGRRRPSARGAADALAAAILAGGDRLHRGGPG